MHSPDKLQLKTCYYGLSQFYSKKFSLLCITSNLLATGTCTYLLKILQYSSGVSGWITYWLLSAPFTIQKEFFHFESGVCECSTLWLIYIASGLLYRQNKKCRCLSYSFCVNFAGRINSLMKLFETWFIFQKNFTNVTLLATEIAIKLFK